MRHFIGAVIMAAITGVVIADTLVDERGATCEIPEGFNCAPYHPDFNVRGMGEFCEFPGKQLIDTIKTRLEQCPVLPYPICNDEDLTISPQKTQRPCYKLVTD